MTKGKDSAGTVKRGEKGKVDVPSPKSPSDRKSSHPLSEPAPLTPFEQHIKERHKTMRKQMEENKHDSTEFFIYRVLMWEQEDVLRKHRELCTVAKCEGDCCEEHYEDGNRDGKSEGRKEMLAKAQFIDKISHKRISQSAVDARNKTILTNTYWIVIASEDWLTEQRKKEVGKE